MDKQTLSNYGWIVIAVLVLAVMIALATPFGNYVKAGVESTTAGLFDTSEKALNVVGMSAGNGSFESGSGETGTQTPTEPEIPTIDHNGATIPEGATTYYVGVTSTRTGDYTGATITLTAGDEFPVTVNTGDVYVYGDYEYRYGQYYNVSEWSTSTTQNGWGVRVLDTTKTSYGAILENINGQPVTNMSNTFNDCTDLTTAPVIPNSVTNMYGTFWGCRSLRSRTTAPAIPNGVTNMESTFYECYSLTTAPAIPDSVTNMEGTFAYCYNLTTAPIIPNSVTNMKGTFKNCCYSLTTAPAIPDSVTNMEGTFWFCSSLTGTITINATPSEYNSCLTGTNITEILGDCTIKAEILATK